MYNPLNLLFKPMVAKEVRIQKEKNVSILLYARLNSITWLNKYDNWVNRWLNSKQGPIFGKIKLSDFH